MLHRQHELLILEWCAAPRRAAHSSFSQAKSCPPLGITRGPGYLPNPRRRRERSREYKSGDSCPLSRSALKMLRRLSVWAERLCAQRDVGPDAVRRAVTELSFEYLHCPRLSAAQTGSFQAGIRFSIRLQSTGSIVPCLAAWVRWLALQYQRNVHAHRRCWCLGYRSCCCWHARCRGRCCWHACWCGCCCWDERCCGCRRGRGCLARAVVDASIRAATAAAAGGSAIVVGQG